MQEFGKETPLKRRIIRTKMSHHNTVDPLKSKQNYSRRRRKEKKQEGQLE